MPWTPGIPAGWVAGDEVYGNDPGLRATLEQRGVGYVLAVGSAARITTAAGIYRVDQVAAMLPVRAWQRLSAGAGAKRYRYYDWAWVDSPSTADQTGQRWVLIRRNRRTHELAFYRCYAPHPVGLPVLVSGRGTAVDGRTILSDLERADRVGRTPGPYLAVVAPVDHLGAGGHLFLAIATATARTVPAPAGLIPLTLNEFRHLFAALVITPALPVRQVGLFSYWRRRHQYRAQESHYQRQADREP